MNSNLSRRKFLAGASALGLTAMPRIRADEAAPNRKIVVGLMGASSRGQDLAKSFTAVAGAEVAYVCDVDERNVAKTIDIVAKKQQTAAKGVADFRRILDDKAVDALVIAAPDHWHAPATILACSAGKHVYCEKPASHNPREGEWMLAAARKFDRRVQLGTQRRSWPTIIEGIGRVRAGEIGRVMSAKCYYFNDRGTIGRGKEIAPPQWLDFSLWQGPAPERPYRDNLIHYNWHWFWHWGTGELGNNAVHFLDVARWGLGVDYPQRVNCSGGRYRFDDDQETPDTTVALFEYPGKSILWEQRSWNKRSPLDPDYEMGFFGEKGALAIRGGGYSIYDLSGKETEKKTGLSNTEVHVENFLNAIRDGKKLTAEIEEGVTSTQLCHIANISFRTGRAMEIDPKSHRIANDKDAMKLWEREYQKGWKPSV